MPKRSSHDAFQAVMPAAQRADSGTGAGVRSRSGRVVKPKVWDDGTVAAPVAALKEETMDGEAPEREAGGDPDYSDDAVEEHLSEGSPGAVEHEMDSEDDRYSDGPMHSYGSHGSRGRYGASRDESGKFTVARPRAPRGGKGGGSRGGGGGGIFKQAAVEVLRQEKRLLSTGEIARLALKRGLIKCSGKTPEATMASALYTDIKRREGQSVFIRPHEGLFGLREWIDQGVPFQDDYAEELAKRARSNFGYPVPLMPAVVDKEGKPLAGVPYYSTYGAPMVDPAGSGALPLASLPPLPHHYVGGGKGKGRGGSKAAVAAAAATAAAAAHLSGEDDHSGDEGLMQLLNAAEELHRSSSREAHGQSQLGGQPPVDRPPSAGSAGEETSEGGRRQSTAAADAAPPSLLQQLGLRLSHGGEACSSEGDAVLAEQAGSEEPAAAAAGFLLREGSAVPSEGGSKGDAEPAGQQPLGGSSMEHSEEEAGAAGLAGLAAAGYPYFPHPYLAAEAAQRPGVSQGTQTEEEEEREGGAALSLVVTGSAKPLQAQQRAQQAAQHGGQEQVNILNLPLPDFECGAMASAAAPAKPQPEVSRQQLHDAEALVMRLEGELGTSHPEVGKALLTLAKLYMAEAGPSSRQLATAAISRAQDIMTVCQVALNRQTSCGASFAYLIDKAKAPAAVPCALGGASAPRAMDITVAAGDAALLLTSPPPRGQ